MVEITAGLIEGAVTYAITLFGAIYAFSEYRKTKLSAMTRKRDDWKAKYHATIKQRNDARTGMEIWMKRAQDLGFTHDKG